MLHEFLTSNREELISRCRMKAAKRRPQAEEKLADGIPVFLDQLGEVLRAESLGLTAEGGFAPGTSAEIAFGNVIGSSAGAHGIELLLRGFSVDQVVHDYGDLCQAVTELAMELNAAITIAEFHTLNRCLDNAIAGAVSQFARERDRVLTNEIKHSMTGNLGSFVHELRNLINTATLAVGNIKRGQVGIAGSTGAILDRSLKGLQQLTAGAFIDVRLSAGLPEQRERILVSELIEETTVSAAIEARTRGLELIVPEVEAGLAIKVDRQILAGALGNLLQNAFKFTGSHGHISVTTLSSADRVLIEIEDECGGLPDGNAEDLFRQFEQRGADRSGLGLGLSISRRGVEANGGQLRVRNLPGKGCVFTIDLPKAA